MGAGPERRRRAFPERAAAAARQPVLVHDGSLARLVNAFAQMGASAEGGPDSSAVRRAEESGCDQEVCGGSVAGDGNVPHDRDPQQRSHVGFVGLGLEWVPEEEEDVDVSFDDPGADLLISAERPGPQNLHFQFSSSAISCPVLPVANSSWSASVSRFAAHHASKFPFSLSWATSARRLRGARACESSSML